MVSHQLGVRGLLECHPLFAALPAATLDKLSFAASARAFSAGQRLTKQGATAEAIHVLLSGSSNPSPNPSPNPNPTPNPSPYP